MKKLGLAALAAMLVLTIVVPAVMASEATVPAGRPRVVDIVYCYESEDGLQTVLVDEEVAPYLPGHPGACEEAAPPALEPVGAVLTGSTTTNAPVSKPGPPPAPSATVGIYGCGWPQGTVLVVDVNYGVVATIPVGLDGCVDARVLTAALPSNTSWARLYFLFPGGNVAWRLAVANSVACQIHGENDECIWLDRNTPADFVITDYTAQTAYLVPDDVLRRLGYLP